MFKFSIKVSPALSNLTIVGQFRRTLNLHSRLFFNLNAARTLCVICRRFGTTSNQIQSERECEPENVDEPDTARYQISKVPVYEIGDSGMDLHYTEPEQSCADS